MNVPHLVGLAINSPLVMPGAKNFLPAGWPPPPDFPVIIDKDGAVVARYADVVWPLAVWTGKSVRLNFEDDGKPGSRLSPANGELLRRIAVWWMYGPNGIPSANTLSSRFHAIKCIFILCSEHGIAASGLMRYPAVRELVVSRVAPSQTGLVMTLLHDLWCARETLGFELLDSGALAQLNASLPDHENAQTAYIPPRIWAAQLARLRTCLDEFTAHSEQIEACYRFCIDAYAVNAGGLNKAFNGLKNAANPFDPQNLKSGRGLPGCQYHGAFRDVAQRFGIFELLDRWVNTGTTAGVKALSSYLSLVSWAGITYSLNFSLMRIDEASQLRTGCYNVERDEVGEDIHTLGGVTTKTIVDEDARWIVSPTVSSAIDALTIISRLRVEVAAQNPARKLSKLDTERPLLFGRAEEPWVRKQRFDHGARQSSHGYDDIPRRWPKLFDPDELRITASDLDIARLITPSLDPTRFSVGKVWPFAYHQLRRTGAVNMLSTGLVAESALQFQLKHATRAMSRYYGQNFFHLKATRVEQNARAVYVRAMYESIAREFALLGDARHVSPYGEKRKEQLLILVAGGDHKSLVAAGKAGRVAYRETFLGGCCNPGPPCPFGGLANIAECMGRKGEHPCQWALLDRAKRPRIVALHVLLADRLTEAEAGSFLQESLRAQMESAEKALETLDA